MSANKTEHLNLHQWEQKDPFLRTEFNENFSAVDSAAKELGEGLSGAVSALSAKIDGLIAVGTYQGDNTRRFVNLGFTPRFVFVCGRSKISSTSSIWEWDSSNMGAAAKDVPLMVPGQAGIIMEVAEGGFYVGAHSRYLNHSNENYLYLAVQ